MLGDSTQEIVAGNIVRLAVGKAARKHQSSTALPGKQVGTFCIPLLGGSRGDREHLLNRCDTDAAGPNDFIVLTASHRRCGDGSDYTDRTKIPAMLRPISRYRG